MKQIELNFTHIHYQRKYNNEEWGRPILPDLFLKSSPMKVDTYDNLVMIVAQIAYYNRNLQLFYRGQEKDYSVRDKTSILPSIYRKKSSDKVLNLKENFKLLEDKAERLKNQLKVQFRKPIGASLINKYQEICWSVLQHYGVCPTPLLDLTHSLHVACSFAFDENKERTGIIYVFGLPMINESINFYTYEELLNIKLLGICPPEAKRPYFQEGYLGGPFPNYRLDDPKRVVLFDFSRRLLAKFEIPIDNSFWGEGFQRIPHNKLYQPDDKLKVVCDSIKI